MQATEDFGDTEIGDLQAALVGEKEVIELDVAMRDPVPVQVGNPMKKLFEETEDIVLLKVSLFHEGKQIPRVTVFHDLVKAAGLGAETDSFHHIRMVQTVCDAEL